MGIDLDGMINDFNILTAFVKKHCVKCIKSTGRFREGIYYEVDSCEGGTYFIDDNGKYIDIYEFWDSGTELKEYFEV